MASIFNYVAFQLNALAHIGVPLVFWVRPKRSESQIPAQTGKVIIVTGGNSGIGYETTKAMYEAGATVYLACRDTKRGQEAVESIKRGVSFNILGAKQPEITPTVRQGGSIEVLELDLADLDSVEKFVKDFESREKRLDTLFANAGVMASPEGLYTKQGYTLQFGTNCLGHQRLISLLLPRLLQTSQSGSVPRVISSSSVGHTAAPKGGVDFVSVVKHPEDEASTDAPKRGRYEKEKWVEYGQSKWGNIAVAKWLHWAYGPAEGGAKKSVTSLPTTEEGTIAAFSLHPGCIATNLGHHLSWTETIFSYFPWLVKPIVFSPVDGATNQLWLATLPDNQAHKLCGEYIVPFQSVGLARPDLDDEARVNAVWDWCEAQGKRTQ